MSRLIESTLAGKISNILVESENEKKICPRCGKVYTGYPAVSRYDNKTEICSDCGTDEAMIQFSGGKLEKPTAAMDAVSLRRNIKEESDKPEEGKEILNEKGEKDFTVVHADSDKISELEKGSAFTFEGLDASDESLQGFVDFMKEKTTLQTPVTIYTWTGKEFNEKYGLTGDNAYPDDLTFVSVALDSWKELGNLPMIKFQVGARWLDDIVDNNAYRQGKFEESVGCDPTPEDLEKDEEKFKAKNKKKIEDRIGELRQAIQDGVSDDEKTEMEKEIADLESQLNECDKPIKESFNFNDLKEQVKDAVYAAFEGSDFTVSGVELGDDGLITFNVTAYGPEDEEGNTEMSRDVELHVPELNYLDAVTNACSDWMSEHDSPDNFYESAKPKTLKEDSYEEPFFESIENALIEAGFNVDRYSNVGMLTKNLGWVVSNSEGEVNLTCAGTYLDECNKQKKLKESEDVNDFRRNFSGNLTNYINKSLSFNKANKQEDLEKLEDIISSFKEEIDMINDDFIEYINSSMNESVEVATNDGSTVSTAGAASVQSNDGQVTVTTDDTTVVINNEPALPVEEVPVEEPELSAETSGDVVPDEPVEDIPVEDEPTEEPVDGEEVVEESAEVDEPTEGEEIDDADLVDAKSVNVVKNQGNIYMLQIERESGEPLYYVCENYNIETYEGDNAAMYESKEQADEDYLGRVGL